MEEKIRYLFREAGGTLTTNWFVISEGPRHVGYNYQNADSAMRELWKHQAEGDEIVDRNVPIKQFERAYNKKCRELNDKDREELVAAERELIKIFGSKEKYFAKEKP